MITYYAKLYLLTLVAFLMIDGLWLGLIARGFYGKHPGFLLKSNPNWVAAASFHVLFVAGVVLLLVCQTFSALCGKSLCLRRFLWPLNVRHL